MDDSDYDSDSTASKSSLDEEELNRRVHPYWPRYRKSFAARGFRLDTVRDVKAYYRVCAREGHPVQAPMLFPIDFEMGEDALCPDAGLPDNLFRGKQVRDNKNIIVKAVHRLSSEFDIIRYLSRGPWHNDSMNHTIPVVDLFEVPTDNIAFIVMEEWSSQLIVPGGPCCLNLFLASLRQCIEHVVFMHKLNMAHLDISLRNLLTNYKGQYAYIDFEMARRFGNDPNPRVIYHRGTEIPPECVEGSMVDPFKVDVWALGVLVLRACKMTGFNIPRLLFLVKSMLHDHPQQRPSSLAVLRAFDTLVPQIGTEWTQSHLADIKS